MLNNKGLGLLEVLLSLLILSIIIGSILTLQNKSLALRNIARPKFDSATAELKSCQIKKIKTYRVIVCEEFNFPKLTKYIFF